MSVRHDSAEPPTVPVRTDHIEQRWEQRIGSDVSPATAWHDGYEVTQRLRTYLPPSEGFHALHKRCRYHPETDALLICRGYKLATVIAVDGCASPAVRHTIRLAFGSGGDGS